MARTTWKERQFLENWTQRVYSGVLFNLETEGQKLQKLVDELTDLETKNRFQSVVDKLSVLIAQANGKHTDFNLSSYAMPEQQESLMVPVYHQKNAK